MLFVTAAICGLYTLSNLIYRYLDLTDSAEFCAIIAHGASIVLFFHLLGKTAGISIYWRIAIDAFLPTFGFAVWHTMFQENPMSSHVVFPPTLVAGFYLIKFSISAVVVEFVMQTLEKRWQVLKRPTIAG